MNDLYATLGVKKTATPAEIKKAYRKKASSNHSDREGGDDKAMAAINVAYGVLSNPEKRKRFDETGDDGQYTPSMEDRAVEVILTLAKQIIEKAPDHIGIVAEILKTLERGERECTQMIAKKRREVLKYEKRRKTVKAKKSNIFDGLFAQQIEQLARNIQEIEAGIKVNAIAANILKDGGYEDVIEAKEIVPNRIFEDAYINLWKNGDP